MGLTGDILKGKDLAKCGVATHFVPKDNLAKLKTVLLDKVNYETELESLENIVKDFSEIVYTPEDFSFPRHEIIQEVFQLDSIEAVFERLTKLETSGNQSEKAWAQKSLGSLNRASPLSLVITFEQIKRGLEIKSKEEAFNLEAQLVSA